MQVPDARTDGAFKGAQGRGRATLASLQALRFLAAAMIVMEHVLYRSSYPFEPFPFSQSLWLQSGVDVFFVISGFIMVYVVGPDTRAGAFWWQRFTRIVPLYWIATAIAFFGGLLAPDWFFGAHSVLFALRSALLLPMGETPEIRPLVGTAWTLIFEFAFYTILAVCLAIRRPPFTLAALAIGILVCGSMIGWAHAHWLGYYAYNLVMLEFLFGMALAGAIRRVKLPPWLGPPLAAAGFVTIYFAWNAPAGFPRGLVIGLPATLVVAGFLISEPLWQRVKPMRALAALGDASFAIYIAHLFLVDAVTTLFTRSAALRAIAGPYGYVAIALCVGLAGGIMVHLVIERPLLRLVRIALPATIARLGSLWQPTTPHPQPRLADGRVGHGHAAAAERAS